eukprot:403363923
MQQQLLPKFFMQMEHTLLVSNPSHLILTLYLYKDTGMLEFSGAMNIKYDSRQGPPPYLTLGMWQHFAYTFNTSHIVIYQNGKEMLNVNSSFFYATPSLSMSRVPGFSLGDGNKINMYMRDLIFWKGALNQSDIQQVMYQVGDVKYKWENMLRYFKLIKTKTGRFHQDMSPKKLHHIFNPLVTPTYINDPKMDYEIGESLKFQDTDQGNTALQLDDAVNHYLKLPIPQYPKVLDTFTIEFWMKFIKGTPANYQFQLIADFDDPNYFAVTNQYGDNTKICIFFNYEPAQCSQFTANNIGQVAWLHYSMTYVKKINSEKKSQVIYQTLVYMDEYKPSFLISYWKLVKNGLSPKILQDKSMNPQYSEEQSRDLVFLTNVIHQLTICKMGQEQSFGKCIDVTSSTLREGSLPIFTFSGLVAPQIFIQQPAFDNGGYIIEFMAKATIDQVNYVTHEQFTYFSNFTNLKRDAETISTQHQKKSWQNHMLKFFVDSVTLQTTLSNCFQLVCNKNTQTYPDLIFTATTNNIALLSQYTDNPVSGARQTLICTKGSVDPQSSFLNVFVENNYLQAIQNGYGFFISAQIDYNNALRMNRWYQVTFTYRTLKLSAYLGNLFSQPLFTDSWSVNPSTFQLLFSSDDSTIMYGCDNQNTPKGFAVRDMSYLEMALHPNDILFYSRIQYKMGNYTGMQYVGLKDGENSWIYDIFNENYVNHIKSKDNNNKDLYWTYEPFPPVICHGDYQTMDPDRLLCQDIASLYLQDTMTNQLLFQNVPLDPIITDQTEFTFLFFAQILFVQENKKHHIYQFNPTALSDSDKLIMFYESQILPDSSIANYMRHAFHEQPTFSIATDFNVWNLYGLRCTINGYIINFDRYTYSQTQNNINRPTTSYLFDKQLQIGGQYLYQTNNLTNPKMKIRDIMFLPNVVLTDYLVLQFQYKKMNRIGPYSVPFHYPLTENSLIQLQYNKGITDSIEYQMFVLNSYPGIESFYISDTFNYDRSVKFYRYAGSNKMFSNFQPSQQIDDWTFQFYAMISADQPVSKNIFLHSSWLKINTIQSNQTYQLIFLPHLTTQTYSLFTAETFQLNQWVYTTITYKHSENQLDFYKDGLQLNQLEGGEPIPTDLAHLLLDSGKFIWIPTFHYDSANMDLTSFCSQDQVFDGLSCQTFKYLWLKTDEVSDLMLPILNLKTNPQEFTLEFWFLLVKNQRLGNIFQLQLDSGTDLQYICLIEPTTLDLFKLINCDNDGHIIPNSATTILNYDQNVDYLLNRPNLIYKLQNWHKFSLIFESSDNSLTAFIDLQQMTNQIFLTTIAAQTLSKMKEMKFCFSNQFYQLLIPIRSQFGQTFIKYPQLMELQLFVGLDQLKMIKENNVNYNRGLVKWKFIEYFQFLAYLCKMVPLCYNKSWKQQISFGFQRFSSIKQWHFKLNDWTFKWVQLSFRMLYGLYPNHPGLVKYYKFNDERILELVSNRENRVSSGQNLISSSDDTFDFSCPAGYSFQDNLNDCMFGFSYTQINNYGWLKMNYKNYLEPLIKEQDYTFTFLTTVATGASYTGNFFNNLDLFKVISVNKTSYQTSYKWGSQYSSPISSNAGMYWFFNYDVSRGVFSYYVGTTLISQSQFKSTEMPDFENYIMRFGSETSTVDVYLKNFQIFYPQLTIVEISKIVNGQGNQFKYKSGLISMFETQFNKYTVLYDYDAHPYDMIGETWDTLQSYEQAPTQIRQTTGWNVCPFNFISKSYYCYPYSSLLIQQGKLELNTAALKIGYSATILFDFTVLKFPTAPSSPIILMHLVQVVIVHILNQQLFVQCLSPNINVANQVFYTQQLLNVKIIHLKMQTLLRSQFKRIHLLVQQLKQVIMLFLDHLFLKE